MQRNRASSDSKPNVALLQNAKPYVCEYIYICINICKHVHMLRERENMLENKKKESWKCIAPKQFRLSYLISSPLVYNRISTFCQLRFEEILKMTTLYLHYIRNNLSPLGPTIYKTFRNYMRLKKRVLSY